jgi:hypothetical protein
MPKKKEDARKKKKPAAARKPKHYLRSGETVVKVFNSGLEVWLYDEANRDTIRRSGAMNFMSGPPKDERALAAQTKAFAAALKAGRLVGYSLQQDDELQVAVIVGRPLTKQEQSVARWLEPQRAFLRLPSGKLCVESNDACRIGPEPPGEKGAVVKVPPGDYRLTLYRVDYEALKRDGIPWKGPQEVVVLTAGGKPADAAKDLLPFEQRRDLDWVGQYRITGKRADALVWMPDYWDTFSLNLDRAAAAKLGLVPGTYFRTTVLAADVSFLSVFANSWQEGMRLPPPAGLPLDEYGYAAFNPMQEWNSTEVLFCRRDRSKKLVEDAHQNAWLPASVEILDAAPAAPEKLNFAPANLSEKQYFDSSFLGLVLSDVFPEAAEFDELLLPEAVKVADKAMQKLGLSPQGDFSFTGGDPNEPAEYTCRVYTGARKAFGAVCATEGDIEVVFLSLLWDGAWIVTGLADGTETKFHRLGGSSKIILQNMDEPLPKIWTAHVKSLKQAKADAQLAPQDFTEAVAAYKRFIEVSG